MKTWEPDLRDCHHPRMLGSAITRLRGSMSQRQLALKAGVAPSYISRIETAERHPSREALLLIAQAAGASEDETDVLLLLAGYAPVRPWSLFAHEPAVAGIVRVLSGSMTPTRRNALRQALDDVAGRFGISP